MRRRIESAGTRRSSAFERIQAARCLDTLVSDEAKTDLLQGLIVRSPSLILEMIKNTCLSGTVADIGVILDEFTPMMFPSRVHCFPHPQVSFLPRYLLHLMMYSFYYSGVKSYRLKC